MDLFAGKGTMGFRLLEEGADSLVLVEISPSLVAEMKQVAARFPMVQVVKQDVFQFLRKNEVLKNSFEFILADPPFPLWKERDFADRFFQAAAPFLTSDGRLIIKSPAHLLPPQSIYDLRCLKSSKVGDSQLVYYQRA